MYQRADDAVVLQKLTGIFHRRGAAVFLIPPYDGSNAGLLLPVIFPADALEKQEEIQGLQCFLVPGIHSILPVQKRELSIQIGDIPESGTAVDNAVMMKRSQGGAGILQNPFLLLFLPFGAQHIFSA